MILAALIDAYRTDPDSRYHKARYATRRNYDSMCRRVAADHGEVEVATIKARACLRWHEDWCEVAGIPTAHGLIGMLRTLCTFGATILDDPDCRALKVLLHDMRFEMPKSSDERLTADQANAIRAKAHEMGLPSFALAQAIQSACMLRQKDVIGEWVPLTEKGWSDTIDSGLKWMRGVRWEEIDDQLVLGHVTSKRQKPIEVDLTIDPMVREELQRLTYIPSAGPVIVDPETGLPYRAPYFRATWRKIARAAGIPDEVKNMHSRAGAISEATDSGVPLELIRHAATHSDIKMTMRYSRGSTEKTAEVHRKRVEYRESKVVN